MDKEIDKQDNEPISPERLACILVDLRLLLNPYQTARNLNRRMSEERDK